MKLSSQVNTSVPHEFEQNIPQQDQDLHGCTAKISASYKIQAEAAIAVVNAMKN
jgi:hypothetical protein